MARRRSGGSQDETENHETETENHETEQSQETEHQADESDEARERARQEAEPGTSAEGDKAAGSELDAAHETARQTTGDDTHEDVARSPDPNIAGKSSTLGNLDPEDRKRMTQDQQTAAKEQRQQEARESGGSEVDLDKLNELADVVAEKQRVVDEAVRERDLARDAYDREVEFQASRRQETHGEMVAQAFAAADAEAAAEKERRDKFFALTGQKAA